MQIAKPKPDKFKKQPDPKRIRATRHAGYERNMAIMRAWKESHPCSKCGEKFKHYAMEFAPAKPGQWSVSRLAGSRCSVEALTEAMQKTKLFCAICLRDIESAKA